MGLKQRKREKSLSMLILNFVLICAMIVNGTYAWIHIGQSVNGALLYINEEHEVILEKYEKDSNGDIILDESGNPIPMEGVGFILCTDSGEQIGDTRLTDEDGRIYATVPVGSFYFEEVVFLPGWGHDKDENGDFITRYEFTMPVSANDSATEVITEVVEDEVLTIEEDETLDNEETVESEDLESTDDTGNVDGTESPEDGNNTEDTDSTEEESEEPVIITVYNRPEEASLEVEKLVKNLDGTALSDDQLAEIFEFTVYFGDEGSYTYYITDAEGNKLVADDSDADVIETQAIYLNEENTTMNEDGEYVAYLSELSTSQYGDISYSGTLSSGECVYLSHGQVAVFENTPVDMYYRISESRNANYYTLSENVSGNITHGVNKAQFVNIYDTVYGRLRVTKEVQGDGFDPDQEFEFTATINGVEYIFTLKDGESQLFAELPVGSTYLVEETDYIADNYYASVLSYEGTLMEAIELELPFINVYDPEDTPGDLVVEKKVIHNDLEEDEDMDTEDSLDEEVSIDNGVAYNTSEDEDSQEEELELADADETFTFEVIFENANNPEEPRVETFELKDGETKVFTNITLGTPYTVRETDSKGYFPDYDTVTGYIVGKKYDDTLALSEQNAQVVTIYNREPDEVGTKELIVTKIVTGDIPELDKEKAFDFTLVLDGADDDKIEFSLKHGESEVFELPAYTHYEVIEADYSDDGYIQSFVTTSDSEFIYQDIEVVVYNDYQREVIEISGEKSWSTKIEAMNYMPEYIHVELWRKDYDAYGKIVSDSRVETLKVTANETGKWTYVFSAAKENTYGIPYEYYILEQEVPNFIPEYSGYDIYNEFALEVSAQIPTVEKQIEGISSTNTKFTFVLKAESESAPMPSGVAGQETIQVIYGSGEELFGDITFKKYGIYRYYITEVNDGLEDWIYDENTYILEYEVELVEGELVVLHRTLWVDGDDEPVDRAVFVNEYIGDPDGEYDPDGENPDEEDEGSKATHIYVEGSKTWDHGLNSAEHQPTKLVVYILGDGEVYQAVETSASRSWSYKFLVPIRNDDGEEISYTIGEEPVDGYNGAAIGYNLYNTFDLASLVEPDSPKTSDYSQIWIWIWGLAASTVTFVYVNRRKRVLRHGRRW